MSDDEFLHFLENEFRRGGFPASKVCFELTETAAVASLHYTADFIRSLRRFECRFALDDFGTGFSSYAYLQSFPVDYLKIDGIFIRDIDANLTNYAMVKSITELGHYLGIEIIAECIENQAAADAVDELGVQWLQGWHVEKPRPLAHSLIHHASRPLRRLLWIKSEIIIHNRTIQLDTKKQSGLWHKILAELYKLRMKNQHLCLMEKSGNARCSR